MSFFGQLENCLVCGMPLNDFGQLLLKPTGSHRRFDNIDLYHALTHVASNRKRPRKTEQ